jgi:glycine oxidase
VSGGGRAAVKDDALVLGAGVMGCAVAFELARRGARVTVLERSVPGAEASSAAAGMLGAQAEAHEEGDFLNLCLRSRARFPAWADALRDATGIDVEHRVCGILRVAHDEDAATQLAMDVAWQNEMGLSADLFEGDLAREIEPALGKTVIAAAQFPRDGRVDPPAWLRALRIGAERAGARFRLGAVVRRVVSEGGRAIGAELEDGERLLAGNVVVAAGSWSTLVEGTGVPTAAIKPARGQIVQLLVPSPVQHTIVWGPRAYLCPRDDGRVLVGSTLEFVGYQRGVTAKAVRDLIDAAIADVPALEHAAFDRAWSSFRPYTKDELPLLGRTGIDKLWFASGHYRNGILLSPITGEVITALVLGETPPIDVTPFDVARLAKT